MFEDASDLIADNPPGLHYGVAVADLDRGRYSFVVAGFGGPNRIFVWSNGALRDVAPPELADDERRAVGVAAGDVDGDGREELYVLNADTFSGPKQFADRLFRRRPDGGWEDLFERPVNRGVRNLSAGRSVAVIDRRGVGRYGFFVANHGRPMRLYELAPGGALADLAPPLELARTGGGRGVLTLPVFSGHPDIFCANERGQNFAYRNRGDGTFEEVATQLHLRDCEEHARGVTTFDWNGEFGLAWVNWDGPHRLMTRGKNGTWKDEATPGFAFPSSVRTLIAADFDNDGNDELFLNHVGEPNRLFRVEPTLVHEETKLSLTMLDAGAAIDAEGLGTGAAICDIDGDGVLELLVARGEKAAQPLAVFKARAAHPNWLRVRPLTRFGAPARGAVVRAEYGGRVRVKGICGGSGYLCQMEPVAHFGLGTASSVDRVTVTWPDGTGVVVLNPGGNRVLTVPYPRG
ncbi:FG-GAP repeat/ASPIC/UnbV domain protein OS=Synechococcus sp. (strain JA-3-3Ab) GN=CYA_0924 PE=4 SV=1: VCBS: VCBS: UnbV_ASPIC [Gemmata massiliana]|uniref:ASPIC/UnbV domain-containing protein n=1 Tax=Gemmata massiliana TaxID=1210884 RepID=A0A6P2D2T1_9BACT|nr:CRTAC1 family protein [Gemmata massiliana]VTR93742.1 FG-GAP repeat/ASPIC/UnbV domain protein OS=Synechococcus sp. (strain JA-3-3Ab) GN=CYA_0924 PE=4 SV=1: VCBS: VCBS: UnbV_ASPIC [Gemmata massiliana]